jgi:hypothetical protein
MGDVYPWQPTNARKDHVDLFGELINYGDTYFKKKDESRHGVVIKLSRNSMEKVLFAVVVSSRRCRRLGDHFVEKADKELDLLVEPLDMSANRVPGALSNDK